MIDTIEVKNAILYHPPYFCRILIIRKIIHADKYKIPPSRAMTPPRYSLPSFTNPIPRIN
jgi:hypothetical protein